MKNKDSGWWDEFFPAFRPFFETRTQQETNAQIKYYLKKLNLKSGSKFLDCPCGIGRISIPMAKKGIKVTGVDITQSYLDEINRKNKRLKVPIETIHSDMRRISFENKFDAAGNLWTSFGYFEKKSDDLLVLKKMYKAIKPGGKFLLEVINRDWIILNFSPSDWHKFDDMKILESRKFDYSTSISNGIWTFIKNGQEKSYDASIRMYSCHELFEMFNKVGFVDIEGFGSIKEDPIDRNTRMMYIIGTKP